MTQNITIISDAPLRTTTCQQANAKQKLRIGNMAAAPVSKHSITVLAVVSFDPVQ